MNAVALKGIRKLEIIDVSKPKISNDKDVLIKIKAVGICGSDIHYYNEGNIGSQVVKYPWVIGHEASGEVVEVGPKVNSLKPGDRIALEPTLWCGECEQCQQGRFHTCLSHVFLGCPGQIEGCMSEYYVLPEHCCFKIPDTFSYDLAVFAEPLSIGIYASELVGRNLEKMKIGILGAGPIGMSVLMACIKAGAKNVFVTDKIDSRLFTAAKKGAKWTANPLNTNILENILSVEPNRLDIIFECCGKQDAIDQGIELLKPGGSFMMIGIPDEDRISIKINEMRRKEICFQNVRRQNGCFQKAIDMIDSDPEYFQDLITHSFELKDASMGFELVRQYQDNVLKAVIKL